MLRYFIMSISFKEEEEETSTDISLCVNFLFNLTFPAEYGIASDTIIKFLRHPNGLPSFYLAEILIFYFYGYSKKLCLFTTLQKCMIAPSPRHPNKS